MKTTNQLPVVLLLVGCACLLGLAERGDVNPIQTANSLSFGGVEVTVDVTDCSTDNSSDGKSRAIAAINDASASMCTIQFGVLDPSSGTYTTTLEEPIGNGQIILGVGGSTFGGAYAAKAGQSITITNNGGKYQAVFKDIVLLDPATKDKVGKKITGNFGCN